jgi:YebC/PmpR family DNA-binding regulatory protein
MAGHSQFANIKFRKDRVDAKRAKTFAKLSRMITVAARQGGGSIDHNARLRMAIDKARVLGMPKDVIERAVKKGTGEGDLGHYEEVLYEGYGPGGVAVVMEILTDNRHRTAADVRIVLEKYGGNLGTSGAVMWMFERRGQFVVDPVPPNVGKVAAAPRGEEELLEIALAAGAEDLRRSGEHYEVLCAATGFAEVKQALEAHNLRLLGAELAYVPNQRTVVADLATAQRLLKMIDGLDDNDDVQAVYTNEEIPEAVRAAMEQA